MKPYTTMITRSFNGEDLTKLTEAGFSTVMNEDGTPKVSKRGGQEFTFVNLGILEFDVPETVKEFVSTHGESAVYGWARKSFLVDQKQDTVDTLLREYGVITTKERKASAKALALFNSLKAAADAGSYDEEKQEFTIGGGTQVVNMEYCRNALKGQLDNDEDGE